LSFTMAPDRLLIEKQFGFFDKTVTAVFRHV
jgi:hypothetical protein